LKNEIYSQVLHFLSFVVFHIFTFLQKQNDNNDFQSSPKIINTLKCRRLRCAGHVARMGVMRNVYKIFVCKHEGKTLFW